MCDSVLAGLPDRSIAPTSTCTSKLERFEEIRTRGKNNLENKLLEMVSHLLEEIIIHQRN